jgi:hypothetical protein
MVHSYREIDKDVYVGWIGSPAKLIVCLDLKVFDAVGSLVLCRTFEFFCLCADPGRCIHVYSVRW